MKIIDIPDLYTEKGFLNFPAIMELDYTYTVIVSMRGGGKTYGALQACSDRGEKIGYFRRNSKSLKAALSPKFHIYTQLCRDRDWQVEPWYDGEMGYGGFTRDGEDIAFLFNLSTFGSIRSIGSAEALGVDWLILDEFMLLPGEVHRYNIFEAWEGVEETLLRNEEINGSHRTRRLLMANSDTIYGEIIAGYGIGDAFMEMQESGIEACEFSPDMLLLRPRCEKLADKKRNTALYRVTAGSGFADVALNNNFLIEDRKQIRKANIAEYVPAAAIRGLVIYRHKSRREWYVTQHRSGKVKKEYGAGDTELRRFMRENVGLWQAYLTKRVVFESVQAQTLFKLLYNC